MKSVFCIVALAFSALVPGSIIAEQSAQVAAIVTVIQDIQPDERRLFVSKTWLNQSGKPCKIFHRRSDDTTVDCKGLKSVSFNLKDFPQDPIAIVRVVINRNDAVVGINN